MKSSKIKKKIERKKGQKKKRIWRERKEENVKDEIISREREGKKEKL